MAGNRWRAGGGSGGNDQPYCKFGTEDGNGWRLHIAGLSEQSAPVPVGTALIIDWLSQKAGPVKWSKPQDFSMLRPINESMLEVPEDYLDGFQVNILFQGHPLVSFTSTSEYCGSALYALHWIYTMDPQAEGGLLPVYVVATPEVIFSSKRQRNFYKIAMTPTGRWIERDESVFGPALLPPPRPRLFADTAPAVLPAAEPVAVADTNPVADALFAEVPVAAATPAAARPLQASMTPQAVTSRSTRSAVPRALPPMP
jgi:hypothetical protein